MRAVFYILQKGCPIESVCDAVSVVVLAIERGELLVPYAVHQPETALRPVG